MKFEEFKSAMHGLMGTLAKDKSVNFNSKEWQTLYDFLATIGQEDFDKLPEELKK